MHGTLNDFIVLDGRGRALDDVFSLARRLCDRRGGIGADGLILLDNSGDAYARMRIVNSDGTEAEMCGNGVRCAARYLAERGEGETFRFETLAGIVSAQIVSRGEPYTVRAGVGTPRFENRDLPFDDADYVWVGNPHAVVFVSDARRAEMLQLGRRMPEANVHAVSVRDRSTIDVRHHERGVGPTQACGTGAVACAASAIRRGLAGSPVRVDVPGGSLTVEWNGSGTAYLTGPAVRVFDASIDS